jgi:high-affinity iron transporter
MFVAAGLIVQMVFWMRKHGRTFKKELEKDMQQNAAKANWWGMLVVVALAVGRESSEAVVFLYGLGAEQTGVAQFMLILALGLAAGYLTFYLLQQGGKLLSWRVLPRQRDPAPAARRCADGHRHRKLIGMNRTPLLDPL